MKPFLRRAGRVARIVVPALALLAGALYLLRWPLLGGLVRKELAAVAAAELEADLERVRLEGSLLWGIEASDLVLRPRPSSPLREASLRRVEVRYGFLGKPPLLVRAEGLRIAFRDRGGPAARPHEIARDALDVLDSLRFEGRAEARDARIALADGTEIEVAEASLEGALWTLRFRQDLFGDVEARAETTPAGAVAVLARATAGPLRAVSLSIAPGRDGRGLAFTVEAEDRALRGAGRLTYEGETLRSAAGEVSLAEGRARATLDFDSGRSTIEAGLGVPLPKPFEGRGSLAFRADGPVDGPLEAWTIREGAARAEGARLRSLRFDEAEAVASEGGLRGLPVRLRVRRGGDSAEGEGSVRWKDALSGEGRVTGSAAILEPYLALVEPPPPVRASVVRVQGAVTFDADRFTFDGALEAGPGSAGDHGWAGLRAEGSVALPGTVEVRDARVLGSPFAPELSLRGRLDEDAFSAGFVAGEDEGSVEGRLEEKGLPSGRFRFDGPLAWLGAFGAAPAGGAPFTVQGALSREGDRELLDGEVETGIGVGGRVRLELRREEGAATLEVSPGFVRLPDDRLVEHDAFRVRIAGEEVAVEGLRARLSDPAVSVAGALSVVRAEAGTRATLSMPEAEAFDAPVGPLRATASRDAATGTWTLSAALGPEGGDHVRVEGTVGERLDLGIGAGIPDLRSPAIRRWLPQAELAGRIRFEARLTGTREEPRVAGRLDLDGVSAFGLPPLTLPVTFEPAGRRVRVRGEADPSPYGRIAIDGELPLPDAGPEGRLDLRLGVDARDLSFLAERIPETARPWLPPASARVRATLGGTVGEPAWTADLEAESPPFAPPAPLGRVEGLRVAASLDASGLALDSIRGTLGLGEFRASGRWDLFEPGRPLAVRLTGREMLVVGTDLVRLRASPDAEITWAEGAGLRAAGRLDVPLLLFHREFERPSSAGRESAREVAPPRLVLPPAEGGGFFLPGIEGLGGLALDLEVSAAGELRIENSAVAALFRGEARVTGNADRPVVSGAVRLRRGRGEVKLGPGIFIRADRAEALLPAEPGKLATVDFEGHTGVGDDEIRIRISGPLSGPSLSLSSNPARPQRELLARLAFGQGPGAVSGAGAGGTAALRIFSELQDERPVAERQEGFFQRLKPAVVAGEAPGQRRVPWELPPAGTVRGTALRTEYVYNSFLSVVAETNRAGDVAGDLKLRLRF